MKTNLPDINSLERITSEQFSRDMDAILDRVSEEDIAIIIEHQDHEYVLSPAYWFQDSVVKELNDIMPLAFKQIITGKDEKTDSILSDILEILYSLTDETITKLINETDDFLNTVSEYRTRWETFRSALVNELASRHIESSQSTVFEDIKTGLKEAIDYEKQKGSVESK